MDAVILTLLGVMGSWNVAVTIWMLRSQRNNKRNNPHNPHPLPCQEHGRTLERLETAINKATNEAGAAHRKFLHDLNETQKTVAVLWNDAYPGQEEPGKR